MEYDVKRAQQEQIKYYTPLDACREAFQNGYDAYARRLEFILHSERTLIQDDGIGISVSHFKSRFMRPHAESKLKERIPPPDWFQGEAREIILRRYHLPRGEKNCGRAAFFKLRNPYQLLTRCNGEEKVRRYTIHISGDVSTEEIEPDGFPEHGTTILIENPKGKLIEEEVMEYMSLISFPIISTKENGGEETPYSDPLFDIFVNEKKVKPKKWPKGKEHIIDEETRYGPIKGKIIIPRDPTGEEAIWCYHKGIAVCPWKHRSLAGYVFVDFTDLETDRKDFVNNTRYKTLKTTVTNSLKKAIPRPEFRPTITPTITIKESVRICRQALRRAEEQLKPFYVGKKRTKKTKTRRAYKPRKKPRQIVTPREIGLGERAARLRFMNKPFDITFERYTNETHVFWVEWGYNPPRIVINDAAPRLEAIRKIKPLRLQRSHFADLLLLCVIYAHEGYNPKISKVMNLYNRLSGNITY